MRSAKTAATETPVAIGYWAALPDICTALAFALVWASPLRFGPFSVKTAMLTMLLEFFLIHATGFFTVFANTPDASRLKRIGSLLGLSSFYVLMIGAFCMGFGTWWPLLGFLWLLIGKILWVRAHPVVDPDDTMFWQMAAWAGSVVAYLFGCFATIVPDIPRWGMTEALQPRFGLTGGGVWIDEPHRVVAFGVVYFGALAAGKLLAAAIVQWRSRR
ncbi:hypothetical protein [Arenimonas sp.]|uniref:hypothetical protein n=1 Tax=Arenimonas sp. TaxID=1872635 RepID=UPI0039E31FFC